MNLSELRVFVTAAEELNFSRAAQRLNLSQSAVSQNIQSIERAYGVELFLRHGRSVQLSETGKTILPMARAVLHSARILEDALMSARGEVSGVLSIGCATTCGRYFVPNLLASFQAEYPNVRTRVTPTTRSQVIEGVLAQTFDLGIVGRKTEHRELENQPLFEDRVIMIVPAGHPWANRDCVSPQEVLEQPFISRENTSATRQALFDELRQYGIEPENLNVVTELGDAEAVEMAVEKGIGITFISELMAARSLALGRVKKVEVEGFNLTQQIYLIRRKAETFTRAETRFWEFVQQHRQALAAELLYNLTNVKPG
ncbi:MAG: selenium metabolism-associated LysR family transcriptional regulator [Anaerolineales bacterium]|nr:selenium metabolism-associated LysR family transcriptional regulator [Anaerolineales bacterium]MCX7754334.1 selenium metabolism-associated LysR family transcriptional regulator [Anaerolineales bacterium]MDW8279063.1 selenium metabolism-associated LysR family transcriptional regulator [Anaerolineales bacterium]